ncbi:hypothetical protein B566_EDAN014011 [Ephemera danica]|nr:hypothetical protein B566_EDAN014011 [Ephemera danica]
MAVKMSYSYVLKRDEPQEYLPSWEPSKNGAPPAGAVPGGITRNGICYIARAKDFNEQWVPAVYMPMEGECFSIARDNRFTTTRDYQILCNCKPKWVTVVVNTLPLPMKSLPVFQSNKNDKEKSFFGRVVFDEHVTFGEVSMDDECCYLFKKRSNQWEPHEKYEVLTLSQYELEELKKQDNPGFFANFPFLSNSNKKPVPTVPAPAYGHKKKGAKGKEDFAWKKGENGSLPPGAFIACRSNNLGDIYVGRCSHKGEVLPGKFIPRLKCCIVGYEGEEVKKYNYEVLCNVKAEWIPMNAGQRNLPEKTILGGKTFDSEPLYIGRVLDKSSVGKVLQGACLVVYGNKEHAHKNFEVLVTSSNPTETKSNRYSGCDPHRRVTDDQHNLMKTTRGQHTPSAARGSTYVELDEFNYQQQMKQEQRSPHLKRETNSDEESDLPQISPRMNDRKATNYNLSEQQNTTLMGTMGKYHREPKLMEQAQHVPPSKRVTTSDCQYKLDSQTAQYTNVCKPTNYNSNEPQITSTVRNNYSDQPIKMEQRQHMISSNSVITSPQTSFDAFEVNSQMRSRQGMNEVADSEYEQSLQKPEVSERHRPSGQAGHDFDGKHIYIARAKHGLCLLVGGLIEGQPLTTYYNKKKNCSSEYEVFCNQNVSWQKMHEGDKIPSNAVYCGYTDEEQNIFVGRVRFQQNALLIAPVYERSSNCFLLIDNQEVPFSIFEIMVTREEHVEPAQDLPIGAHMKYQHVTRNFELMAISQVSQPSSNNALTSSGVEMAISQLI